MLSDKLKGIDLNEYNHLSKLGKEYFNSRLWLKFRSWRDMGRPPMNKEERKELLSWYFIDCFVSDDSIVERLSYIKLCQADILRTHCMTRADFDKVDYLLTHAEELSKEK